MGQRADLHVIFKTFTPNVYFQPPSGAQLIYPCIIYKRDDRKVAYADNIPYRNKIRYQVTAIDPDPDSELHEKIATLPLCSYDRNFAADNLNHDVYNVFF